MGGGGRETRAAAGAALTRFTGEVIAKMVVICALLNPPASPRSAAIGECRHGKRRKNNCRGRIAS